MTARDPFRPREGAREDVANFRAVPDGGADSCLPADWRRTLGRIYRLESTAVRIGITRRVP